MDAKIEEAEKWKCIKCDLYASADTWTDYYDFEYEHCVGYNDYVNLTFHVCLRCIQVHFNITTDFNGDKIVV